MPKTPKQGSLMGEPEEKKDGPTIAGGAPWFAKTRNGYKLDVVISALQKAVRRGREREGLFWMNELCEPDANGKHFAGHFWRRMMIIAHEECVDPQVAIFAAAARSNALYASGDLKNRIETLIEAHLVLVLCRAKKSREACDAAMAVMVAKKEGWRIEPHPSAIDKHTSTGKELGKTMADFGREGRLVAGTLDPNAYEKKHWGFEQPYLPRPDDEIAKKNGLPVEPDVEIPDHKDYHLRGGPQTGKKR